MPLYEYECAKCGNRFEKIESVSASTTKKCPKCGGKAGRLLAAPAIQFKGSGWYVTDYAGRNAAASKESSGDGAGAKTDGKPAAGNSGEGKSSESKSTETTSEKETSKKKK